MVRGDTRRGHHFAEQPVLAERGCHVRGAERQYADAESSDDVRSGLCRGEEHLYVRRGCIRLQQRLADNWEPGRFPPRRAVPTANSVTPNSGSGASQTFALQYSDTAGATSLQSVWAYFNATLANPASNSCLLYYNVAANQINLLKDSATAWLAATPGAATTLQNSQCSLNVAATSVALSGNTLTLNLAMTFAPAYAGAKNIYMYAADTSGSNSGWQPLGSWTVP